MDYIRNVTHMLGILRKHEDKDKGIKKDIDFSKKIRM